MKLAIATASTLPDLDPDVEPLNAALDAAGIAYEWLAWDDPAARFKDFHMILLRSTWNYVEQRERFLTWVDSLGMRLINPPVVVRWNTHKRYLRDLEEAGLATVPTTLIPKGTRVSLIELMKKKHFFKAIAKPAVGAGSFQVRLVGGAEEEAAWFAGELAQRDMLLQPYMPEVELNGERSIIVIEGEPTHAIRKERRLAGDGEGITGVPIADDEAQLARRAINWVERNLPCGKLLYGRVDTVRDEHGVPRIMELEMVEPSLFFAHGPGAAEKYVAGVKWRMETLSVRRDGGPQQ